MRLSSSREKLTTLSHEELVQAIIERRTIIRYHRDQIMDDRCWVDDVKLWQLLEDTPLAAAQPPPYEEAMTKCRIFYALRRAEEKDPMQVGAVTNTLHWDDDLKTMDTNALLGELVRIQSAIRQHRDMPERSRTLDVDRALYSVLPEKMPADFRLPSEDAFLGEAKAPRAGCPSFWRSHMNCPTSQHDIHRWGPCPPQ